MTALIPSDSFWCLRQARFMTAGVSKTVIEVRSPPHLARPHLIALDCMMAGVCKTAIEVIGIELPSECHRIADF